MTDLTRPTLTMTSREIAELTGKNHADVMRDIRNMLEQLKKANLLSWVKSTTYVGKDGRQYPQYELDKDTCLTLLLGYDTVARMKVVMRWQTLEAAQAVALPNFGDPVAAARAWADAKEKEQQALLALEAAKPKVEFVERYVQADSGSKGFRQVCKLLGVKEPEFRQFLKDKGVMYQLGGDWVPYAQHIEAGRFETKTGLAKHDSGTHAFTQAKFTPKGVAWISELWGKHQQAHSAGEVA